MDVVVCDVGLGNLRSVERALVFSAHRLLGRSRNGLGGEGHTSVRISADPEVLRRADKIVMPGQGAFRDCAAALGSGLGEVVKERIAAGTPYLGICLGLQVLFATSDEAPGAVGLGVFPGTVARLPSGTDPITGAALKIPHIGWNTARLGGRERFADRAPTKKTISTSCTPTWSCPPTLASSPATTEYGGEFVSAIAKDNVFACQFHPEKSQEAGIAFLARFLAASATAQSPRHARHPRDRSPWRKSRALSTRVANYEKVTVYDAVSRRAPRAGAARCRGSTWWTSRAPRQVARARRRRARDRRAFGPGVQIGGGVRRERPSRATSRSAPRGGRRRAALAEARPRARARGRAPTKRRSSPSTRKTGCVATDGWTTVSTVSAVDLARSFADGRSPPSCIQTSRRTAP